MNYLAHAYLSFNHPEILVGNMISDFVKGRKKFAYPSEIQKGIALHRAIDQFTDDHRATQSAKLFFRPVYRLYSGAFIDVVYDHFLANDTNEFPFPDDLAKFDKDVCEILEGHFTELPAGFQKILPYMKKYNWLANYKYKSGIEKSFQGLVRRALYMDESSTAFSIFNNHYVELKNCYDEFFYEQKAFAAQELSNLLMD